MSVRAVAITALCLIATHAHAVCGCIGVVAIGDSRTADRSDGQTPWPAQVTEVTVPNGAIPGAVWTGCLAQTPSNTMLLVVQCGVNDILSDVNGNTLWSTVQTYLAGRSALGWRTWVMNIPGFKAYDSTASRLTQRNNFNTAFATYCASPAAGVTCVDIATLLDDPGDTDALLGAYSLDGIHYTTAGHTVIKNAFHAAYP